MEKLFFQFNDIYIYYFFHFRYSSPISQQVLISTTKE